MKSMTINKTGARIGAAMFLSDPKMMLREGFKVSGKYDAKSREEHVERVFKDEQKMKEFMALADMVWFGAIYGDEFWEGIKNDTK